MCRCTRQWGLDRRLPRGQRSRLETTGALLRAIRSQGQGLAKAITADGVYKIVWGYSAMLGFKIGAHALRATAATNALDHQADMAKVQE